MGRVELACMEPENHEHIHEATGKFVDLPLTIGKDSWHLALLSQANPLDVWAAVLCRPKKGVQWSFQQRCRPQRRCGWACHARDLFQVAGKA